MTTTTTTPNIDYGIDDLFKKPNLDELNTNYTDGDSVDQATFADMRSNVLLVAGEHYNKKQSAYFKRIRDSKELSQEQKLRLTKNHIRKICQVYANNIMAMNPGIGFTPKDEQSLHDRKVAEMHHSVWQDAVVRYHLEDRMEDWCDSFIQIGEVALKIFWDESLGEVAGYEPLRDEETGESVFDEDGTEMPDETRPVATGQFVFEEVYGFNLLRPAECKDIRMAEWLCIRKMADRGDMIRKFRNVPNIEKIIPASTDETFMVFDPSNGSYKKTNKQCMIREFYYRPSLKFPEGYFYITTKEGILAEGELPGGIFPIIVAQFDKLQTTPRGRSPIKTMRPYQAEINRSASKIAEHQITLGDDKLLIQNGTKVSSGASLPGVRSVNYTGSEPKILAGRDGSQYVNYMTGQITELYQVMMVQETSEDQNTQLDPFVLLFRSASQKKKFQRYIRRFESFLKEVVKTYLNLAKVHLPDDMAIMVFGKNEQVNIAEFREQPDTCYEVKIEAQSDDIETKIGKTLFLNHAIQYAGNSLKPDDLGKLLRQSPYANFDESFDDITMDYDISVNDMLALDRGETPDINQYDNHPYLIKRLTARTRKPDFKFLPPMVQQNYRAKIQIHEQMEAQRQMEIQRANQGWIPTSGSLITIDFYKNEPNSTGGVKQVKVKVPYDSVDWLLKHLEAQGTSVEMLMSMNQGAQAEIAGMMQAPPAPGPMGPQGGPPQMQQRPPGMMPQMPMQQRPPMGPPQGQMPMPQGRPMPQQSPALAKLSMLARR